MEDKHAADSSYKAQGDQYKRRRNAMQRPGDEYEGLQSKQDELLWLIELG